MWVTRLVLNWAGEQTTETYYPKTWKEARETFDILIDKAKNPQTRYCGIFDEGSRKLLLEYRPRPVSEVVG
jgi:hypothetical protein